ncbi:unnamed protein product [Clavelina lepadiformis]|uniref:Uncharacterized protein n=1 Tax=Clavelina lepadiformis TaxID=159417 RepID=A0ABP0GPW9_CLALP
MLTLNFKGAFTPNPNPPIKWSHFARFDRSLSPNPEDLETGIVFILYRRVQFHHGELVQTPFPTILSLNFKGAFTPNPNPSFKWSHFARCDRSLSPYPEDLETGAFTPNPNHSIKWSHFARCDRLLSPNPEDLETGILFILYRRVQFHHRELVPTPFPTMLTLNFKGAFTPNPNPPIKWSHFARCDRSLSPNPENLETGIVFMLYGREQFHHRELFSTPFPTMLTLNFKVAFTPNPNSPIKWSHFARCDRSLSSTPEDSETGAVTPNPHPSIKWRHFARCDRSLSSTPEDSITGAFSPNPNHSIKWSHFARCDRLLSPNPEDLETGAVTPNPHPSIKWIHFARCDRSLSSTPEDSITGAFTLNPNHSIKWSHFARCDRLLSPNPEDLETDRREKLHDEQLFHTHIPTVLNLKFKSDFTPNPDPPIKWSHFARCDRSLSPNLEYLETGIVFNLYGREQFHHRELVQTPFPTMLTLNFKGAFTPNLNPPIKWSHFARFDRSLSPNPEDLETGIVFILYRRVQFHHGELVQTPFTTILTLISKIDFTHNLNPSIKWSHFARCDRSLSPNPEYLETSIVFNLLGREQFHHGEIVETPFPTMLTFNFKIDFTPNPNPSIKWSHFARFDRSLSPNLEYLETGAVTPNPHPSIKWRHFARCDRSLSSTPEDSITDRRVQFQHGELVPTPFPTMLTLNFKSDFTPNPDPPNKWSHFARCDRSLSPYPEYLETSIVFNLYGAVTPNPHPSIKWRHFARCDRSLSSTPEDSITDRRVQFQHGELVPTPFPTMLTLNFKSDFTPNPDPPNKWSHFARCDRSLSPYPEDLETGAFTPNPNPSIKWSHFAGSLSPNPEYVETGIVFMLYRRVQFHHGELDQTPSPTFLTFIFKIDFTPNPNPSIKWSHFATCDRSLSPNPEYLETGLVFKLYRRVQFHHGELDQTPSPTFLTFIFKIDFTPNPNPSIKWSHFARCDRSLSPNPEDLETGAFTPNPNPSIKWSHFARCDRSLSPNPEDLETDRREKLHDEQLFHTHIPMVLNLKFKSDFTPNPDPPIKWSHFTRCDRSLSPNLEYLETENNSNHRKLVPTPFPTMLTHNFKGAFTPNPNPPIKWSHFARCDRSLSPNPENLETGIVFMLYGREQFHHRELFSTPFPTMLTLNFKGAFTPNPNSPIKWSHFARCDRSLSSSPEDSETGIVFMLYGREQFHHRELVPTPFPTMLTLNFKSDFTPNRNPLIKWSNFASCDGH